MAYWIEIHCDAEIREPGSHLDDSCCFSDNDRSPGMMTTDVNRGRARLIAQAEKEGWKRLKGGPWICPNCQKAAKEK